MEDFDLLRDFTHGSEQAFATLVQRHIRAVYSVALRTLQSPQLAEEVAYSVFHDLSLNAAKVKPTAPLVAWLFRVTRRTALDVLKRERRRIARENFASGDRSERREPDSLPNDLLDGLDAALESLPESDRNLLLARYFLGQETPEIAHSFGISIAAAQKRLERGLVRLREWFLRRGIAVTAPALGAFLTVNAVGAVPAGIVSAITNSLSITAPLAAVAHTGKLAFMTTTQKAALAVLAAGALCTGIYQQSRVNRLERRLTASAREADQTRKSLAGAETKLKDLERQNEPTRAPRFGSGVSASLKWSSLESTDYKRYIANLRAIGCPEETIRDIIISEINKSYAPRLAALARPFQNFGRGHVGETGNARREEGIRALRTERNRILEDLLGPDIYEDLRNIGAVPDYRAEQLAFLPPARREKVLLLEDVYQQREQGEWFKFHGYMDWEKDKAPIVAARDEFRKELSSLLNPDELREYDLRKSEKAMELRQKLDLVGAVSDIEFAKIFDLWSSGQNSAHAKEEISIILGPERSQRFKMSDGGSDKRLLEFQRRFNASDESFQQLLAIRSETEGAAREFQSRSLPVSETQQFRDELAQSTQARVRDIVGADALNRLLDDGGQDWLYGRVK